jgi:hypothetical protein
VNPSRNRVYVWRKLKEFGAGHFKQGVAILPLSPQSMNQFRGLAAKIREMGGDATLAELRFCDMADESRTIGWFERQSEDEYLELLRDCAEVASRLRASLFPPAERDEYLRKLGKRYSKVKARDFFKSRSRQPVVQGLDELMGDMAHATDELRHQLRRLFSER